MSANGALTFWLGVAILGSTSALDRSCGAPIASGPQRGTFHDIRLGTQCDSGSSTGPAVSLGVGNRAPVFWIGQMVAGVCRMTLATIENDAFVPIAQTEQDVGDRPPVDIGDGTYVSASNDGDYYVATDAKMRSEDIVQLVNPASRTRSIAADVNGRAYGIEVPVNGGGEQLVDLERRTSERLPGTTYTKNLTRGADGRLYFEQYSSKPDGANPCTLFAVGPAGTAVEVASCELTGDTTVGASGTVWDSTELGVVLRDPATKSQTRYAPIYAPPCNNFRPSSSYTHNVVADARGNAWFVFRQLWHVDRRGKVSSIAVPEGAQNDAATRGLFETADGTLWLFSKRSAEHFVPLRS